MLSTPPNEFTLILLALGNLGTERNSFLHVQKSKYDLRLPN